MKPLHSVVFCCVFVACAEASSGLEVSGQVGGDVSIPCSGKWTSGRPEHHRVYFCKGWCSGGNVLLRAERRPSAPARRGRFSAESHGRDGVFSVTIKNLRSGDAGPYYCGMGTATEVLHQYQISLIVLDAPTVPPGPPASGADALQSRTEAGLRDASPSSLHLSAVTPTSEDRSSRQPASRLTGTTVVIIVSVSLAFVVCAIIPLIFYGHWRSSAEEQSRPATTAEGSSGHVALGPQDQKPDGSPQDPSRYSAVYQALDPKALD